MEKTLEGRSDAQAVNHWGALRHARTLGRLFQKMVPKERPHSLLYPAAGNHLAPLVLAWVSSGKTPLELTLTDSDTGAFERVGKELAWWESQGMIQHLRQDRKGAKAWHFTANAHPVTLRSLQVSEGAPLFQVKQIEDVGAVILHDFSGDPLELLREINAFSKVVRHRPNPPLLIMEDLEAHPFPVDLTFFGPVARVHGPYGHRAKDGIGGKEERGVPLFGGAVALGFKPSWWRRVDPATRVAFLDFLYFSAFDTRRQNVLEGGKDPLLSPAILDWYSGYAYRTVGGDDLRRNPQYRGRMIQAAQTVFPLLPPPLQQRLRCRLFLYRCLMEILATGSDPTAVLPQAHYRRRPFPGHFPSPAMESLFRRAMGVAGQYRAALKAEARALEPILKNLRGSAPAAALAGACTAVGRRKIPESPDGWRAFYARVNQELQRK